jgi:hypothetical protein
MNKNVDKNIKISSEKKLPAVNNTLNYLSLGGSAISLGATCVLYYKNTLVEERLSKIEHKLNTFSNTIENVDKILHLNTTGNESITISKIQNEINKQKDFIENNLIQYADKLENIDVDLDKLIADLNLIDTTRVLTRKNKKNKKNKKRSVKYYSSDSSDSEEEYVQKRKSKKSKKHKKVNRNNDTDEENLEDSNKISDIFKRQ